MSRPRSKSLSQQQPPKFFLNNAVYEAAIISLETMVADIQKGSAPTEETKIKIVEAIKGFETIMRLGSDEVSAKDQGRLNSLKDKFAKSIEKSPLEPYRQMLSKFLEANLMFNVKRPLFGKVKENVVLKMIKAEVDKPREKDQALTAEQLANLIKQVQQEFAPKKKPQESIHTHKVVKDLQKETRESLSVMFEKVSQLSSKDPSKISGPGNK